MEFTRSKDGIFRATARIEIRVSVFDLVYVCLGESNVSKNNIFKWAKGLQCPLDGCIVTAEPDSESVEKAILLVKKKFPELPDDIYDQVRDEFDDVPETMEMD